MRRRPKLTGAVDGVPMTEEEARSLLERLRSTMSGRVHHLPRLIQNERILSAPPPDGFVIRIERPEGASDPNIFEFCNRDRSLVARFPRLTGGWFEAVGRGGAWCVTSSSPGVELATHRQPSGPAPLSN